MKEKQKIGSASLRVTVDVPVSPRDLVKILSAVSKKIFSEGKPLVPGDVMDITTHFRFNSDESV